MAWFKAITIVLLLSGCSASWHLKKAIQKGALVSSDTVYVEKSVIVPEVTTDTIFHSVAGDTVRIERERLKIKYVRLPGDSVYVEGKCESDTIFVKTPVYVKTEIKAPPSKWKWWHIVLAAFGGLLSGAMLIRIFR